MTNTITGASFRFELTPEQIDWALGLARALSYKWLFEPGGLENADKYKAEIQAWVLDWGQDEREIELVAEFDGDHADPDGPKYLWIHHDQSIWPEHAAWYVQRILAHFDLDTVVLFHWATWAERPALDGFSGGAVVVTKDAEEWFEPGQDAGEHRRQLEEAQNG